MEPTRLDADYVSFIGDAQFRLTAPFHPDRDALGHRPPREIPPDGMLDNKGRIALFDRSTDEFVQGSLTFDKPNFELLTHFQGSRQFNAKRPGRGTLPSFHYHTAVQALTYGERVFGCQYHPELSPEDVHRLIDRTVVDRILAADRETRTRR
jgi:hypothetical protein